MESGNVFVEVYREEVEALGTSLERRMVVLHNFVPIIRSFGGNRSNLLVAPSIARDEEDRNPSQLQARSACFFAPIMRSIGRVAYLGIVINALFPVQIERVFAGKSRVLSIEVIELGIGRHHVGHAAAFGVELPVE